MNKHQWKGEQKTYEQAQRERLDSFTFTTNEAAKDAAAERAERKFAAASVRLTPEQDRALAEKYLREEDESRRMHCSFLLPPEAAWLLCRIKQHELEVGDELLKHLRRVAGVLDKHELSPPAPEPYEEHAMGMHD